MVLTDQGMSERRVRAPDDWPTVRLARSAHDSILRIVQNDEEWRSSLEIGGPLIGSVLNEGHITRAAGPGANSARRTRSFRFNGVDMTQQAGKQDVVGLWHSHPSDGANGALSDVDLDAFTEMTTSDRVIARPSPVVTAIIVTRGDPPPRSPTAPATARWDKPRRWAYPVLSAWLVARDWHEAARLEIVDDPPREQLATRANRKGWMTATRSFTARDGSHRLDISTGERVIATHPIVSAYPQHFQPARPR